MNIESLRQYCGTDQIIYSQHFLDRCRERSIRLADTETAILTGEIIEDYPTDYPFPSCLILGACSGNDILHIVCAEGNGHLYMISAYRPSPDKWESDWKTRRKEPVK